MGVACIGIESISVFGLPPVEFVNLAADLGCKHISTNLSSAGYNPHGYNAYSLRDDRALRAEMIAAMLDRGVSISCGEGLNIRPGGDVRLYDLDLDIMCELGVGLINMSSLDPDLARSLDQFALLAEMAGSRGLQTSTEFAPCLTIRDLPAALAAVAYVDRSNFRVLIDTMHLVRSGSTAADIAALDPALIAYVQISDAPRISPFESYMEEAMFERLVPGEGQLGLLEIVKALPHDRVYGLEIPFRSQAEAGIGPHQRLERCVAATRQMLAAAEAAEVS